MSADRPLIGIFDSGVGGLTVVREVRRLLGNLDILYFGDTARVPYGNKSPETILRYSLEIGRFLAERGVDFLVVACNTSSATALVPLAESLSVPVLGMIEPGARMAASVSKNGRIGLIGTRATVASGAYEGAIRRFAPEATVISVPCPLFVPLVEEGWADDPVSEQIARRYLAPLVEGGVDTLILGCTHYPVMESALLRVVGPDVRIVSSAEAAAFDLRELLRRTEHNPKGEGSLTLFVTDASTHFKGVAERILGNPVTQLEVVEEERLVLHAK